MESSIAVFLVRQAACEHLPTFAWAPAALVWPPPGPVWPPASRATTLGRPGCFFPDPCISVIYKSPAQGQCLRVLTCSCGHQLLLQQPWAGQAAFFQIPVSDLYLNRVEVKF